MMLKQIKLLITLPVLCFHTLVYAQDPHFTYAPEKAKSGETVQITYNPKGTPLAGKKNLQGVVYSFNNYKWHTSDLPMQQVGDVYKASLKLDKHCGMAAVKFKGSDTTDNNNDKGYAIMAIDSEHPGINAAGAYAGWGMLRSQGRGYGIPDYYKNLNISDTAFYYWMNNEISWHAQEASQILAVPFVSSIYAYQKEEGLPRISRVVAYLSKIGGEDNLLRIREIYLNTLDRKRSADSLDREILAKYPNGNLARLMAYRAFTNERKPENMVIKAKDFLQAFPQTTDNEFDLQHGINYNNVYQAIILIPLMKGDYSALDKYHNQLSIAASINLYTR